MVTRSLGEKLVNEIGFFVSLKLIIGEKCRRKALRRIITSGQSVHGM